MLHLSVLTFPGQHHFLCEKILSLAQVIQVIQKPSDIKSTRINNQTFVH